MKGVGLFGKMTAQRDYVVAGVPRQILDIWEPWVDAGLRHARDCFADAWPDPYMQAPLWRFAWGAEVAGSPVCGVWMPSVDAVGRTYPLAVFAAVTPEPDHDEAAVWFDTVESFLLSTLDEHRSAADVLAGLATLRPAPSLIVALAETRWWTQGGDTLPSSELSTVGLPGVEAFAGLLAPGRAVPVSP